MSAPALVSVSVDLDGARQYHAIHGLPAPAVEAHDPVLAFALPRFVELFDALEIRATFFVIARDLDDPHYRAAVLDLDRRGHEIANHSLDHPYDLVLRPPSIMEEQVREGARRIADVIGRQPAGFRAPGYTVTDELLEIVADAGARYDSSVFPCPVYWSAKAVTRAAIRARGRQSRSILGSPSVLKAPADPYRIGRPYHRRGTGLLELPIGVTRGPRLPFIGTSLTLAGARGARWLARAMRGRPLVNLELHGIDLSDASEDGLDSLRERQPDLRLSVAHKRAALCAAIDQLRLDGARFLPLVQAAENLTVRA